jgi:ABC-type nitrate/sulfonate/bicarbonate transport system substrate-binding protein
MKIALEWFINPDHLPFIVAKELGIYKKHGIDDFTIIEPNEHYDGLEEIKNNTIEFATNEPLHLIEQFHDDLMSLGMFFETKGGVVMKKASFERLKNGGNVKVTSPVSNEKTDGIGFEIIKRYCKKQGFEVKKEQVSFHAIDFYHTKNMQQGYDAGWLYFYNFEGVEIAHTDLEVIYMDAQSAGFANFAALDIFTSKTYYQNNVQRVENFVNATKEAIAFIATNPDECFDCYYRYTQTKKSDIMDEILVQTAQCFDANFTSSYAKELPILEFFQDIGISDLNKERFKTAFIH